MTLAEATNTESITLTVEVDFSNGTRKSYTGPLQVPEDPAVLADALSALAQTSPGIDVRLESTGFTNRAGNEAMRIAAVDGVQAQASSTVWAVWIGARSAGETIQRKDPTGHVGNPPEPHVGSGDHVLLKLVSTPAKG